MYVASWAVQLRPFATRGPRMLYLASMAMCSVLLVFSLSRSVMIAAAVWPMIILYRSARTLTLTGRQIAAAYGVLAGAAVLSSSGFATVLYIRFTEDTSSYKARSPCTPPPSATFRVIS